MRVPKIAVTFSEDELAQVRRDAGLVPLSAWIRNCTIKTQPESEQSNGSTANQNVSRVAGSSIPGRRASVSGNDSIRSKRSSLLGKRRAVADGIIGATTETDKPPDGSLGPETLGTVHTATSNRLTCLCNTCSTWRKNNAIPLGGLPKKEKAKR